MALMKFDLEESSESLAMRMFLLQDLVPNMQLDNYLN